MKKTPLPGSPANACLPIGRDVELRNGPDEERYVEGMVVINEGSKIGGVYDTPENIGFGGYLYSKLPEKNRKGQMDNFKELAK
jgi:hypothetical protein